MVQVISRADVRAHAGLLRGHVKARRAVDAVAVHDGHGGHAELRAGAGQLLGDAGAFEEAEGGAGVEFDVGWGTSHPRRGSANGRGSDSNVAAVSPRLNSAPTVREG